MDLLLFVMNELNGVNKAMATKPEMAAATFNMRASTTRHIAMLTQLDQVT